MAKISGSLDPCFVGRNAAVLHSTQVACLEEASRRRMSNALTHKPGRFDGE